MSCIVHVVWNQTMLAPCLYMDFGFHIHFDFDFSSTVFNCVYMNMNISICHPLVAWSHTFTTLFLLSRINSYHFQCLYSILGIWTSLLMGLCGTYCLILCDFCCPYMFDICVIFVISNSKIYNKHFEWMMYTNYVFLNKYSLGPVRFIKFKTVLEKILYGVYASIGLGDKSDNSKISISICVNWYRGKV